MYPRPPTSHPLPTLASSTKRSRSVISIANDRTELLNLATAQPARLDVMVKQWHEMTEFVLTAPKQNNLPVASEASVHMHPEWSNFDRDPATNPKRVKKK
jgi:hypothetical protein